MNDEKAKDLELFYQEVERAKNSPTELQNIWRKTLRFCHTQRPDILYNKVDRLIKAGVDVNTVIINGRTALYTIEDMFNRVNADDDGYTITDPKAEHYFMKIADKLFKAGAKVSDNLLFQHVKTPNWTKQLVKHGVNVKARSCGYPAIMRQFNPQQMKILLDAGADIDAQDAYGRTPLMHWLQISPANKTEVISFLIENGADLSKKDYNGHDVLYYAQTYCDKEDLNLIKEALQAKNNLQRIAQIRARKVHKQHQAPDEGKQAGNVEYNKYYMAKRKTLAKDE